TGNLQVDLPLDTTQSSNDCGCGDAGDAPMPVYNSSTVDAHPIVAVDLNTDSHGEVPSSVAVTLTWDGGAQTATQTFTTAGHSAGDALRLGLQLPSAVATTGDYAWQARVTAYFPDRGWVTRTVRGSATVVTRPALNFLGAGWGLAGADQLLVTAAGALWIQDGGERRHFFTANGDGSYTSPPADFGHLRAGVSRG